MKLTKTKGSKQTWEAGFCCLRRRPDEAHQDQRQQVDPRSRIFAASAVDPMKHAKIKGSKSALEKSVLLLLPRT